MPANMKKAGIKYQRGGMLGRLFGKKKKKGYQITGKQSERELKHQAWVKNERKKMNLDKEKKAAWDKQEKAAKLAKRAERKSRKQRIEEAARGLDEKRARNEASDRRLSDKFNELKYDWNTAKDPNVKKYIEEKMKRLGSVGPYEHKAQLFGKPKYKGRRANERTSQGSDKHWEMKSGGSVFNKQGMKVPGMQIGGTTPRPQDTRAHDPNRSPAPPQGKGAPRPPVDPNKVPAPPVDPRRGQTVPGQAPAPMQQAPTRQVDPNRIVNDIVNAGPEAGRIPPPVIPRPNKQSPVDGMYGNTTPQGAGQQVTPRQRRGSSDPFMKRGGRYKKGGATGPNGIL